MNLNIEFSGGLELIFNKEKKIKIEVKDKASISVKELLLILKEKIVEKPEFFLNKDNQVYLNIKLSRPGILVLINDSDWEIYEKENTMLSNNDSISFISTLHGG